MKLIYGSLGAMLADLRARNVGAVRVASCFQSETGRTAAIPYHTSRIVVTAQLDGEMWAEFRVWVGRGIAEVAEGRMCLPEALRQRGEKLLSEVKEQIKAECFAVLEGMLAHDAAGADGYVDGGTQSGAPVAAEPAC